MSACEVDARRCGEKDLGKGGDPYLEAIALGGVGIARGVGRAGAGAVWGGLRGVFGREGDAASALWAKGVYRRGKAIEDALGVRLKLGTNLNKLWGTDFVRGVDFAGAAGGRQVFSQVTSVNLSSASNASGARIAKTLSAKADSLRAVVASGEVSFGKRSIEVLPEAQKQLVVAISSYKPSWSQISGLTQTIQYGQSIGVKVVIRVVR